MTVLRNRASALSRAMYRVCFASLLATFLAPHSGEARERHAAMVIDANTGSILHEASANELRYPASLTKMMTLYMVFEEIERGRLSYGTRISISAHAAAAAPSKLGLDPGDEITVLDAIKALVTKSANDIAVALGEHVGGSEPRFAELMTEKARAIGMSRTTFRNASGLPDAGQVTTARDMLTLALRLQDDFPKHYPLFATQSFTFRGETYRTHNGLMRSFEGTDGIKTGYTRLSGFNLVSSVRRGNRRLVGAVFGGSTPGARNAEMRMLLTRALFKASAVKTRKSSAPVFARSEPQPAQRKVVVAKAPSESAPAEKTNIGAAVAEPESQPSGPARSNVAIAKVKSVALLPRTASEAGLSQSAPPATAYEQQPTQAGEAVGRAVPAVQQTEGPKLLVAPAQVTRRGTAPSTLQQQASNLAAGLSPVEPVVHQVATAPQRAEAVVAPTQPPAADSSRPFLVQVGAYSSAVEAERALTSALERASNVLATAAPVTAPVQMGDRQLFRARFSGFDSQTAATTCVELRRRQIDCLVVRTP